MPDKSVRERLKSEIANVIHKELYGEDLSEKTPVVNLHIYALTEAIIDQALSSLASAVRGMPRTAFLGRYAKTIREITINDVARWVEGKEGR